MIKNRQKGGFQKNKEIVFVFTAQELWEINSLSY